VRYLLPILVLAAAAIAALAILDRDEAPAEPSRAGPTPSPTAIETATPPPGAGGTMDVRRVRCPDGVPDCRAARGTVVYVESVDPDGDGDLHVVIDGSSITLPGMTAIDIAPELRPKRDPRVGDRVSAAGPVQTGSYGQSQIHALEFRVRRG
jgi:hypothetical protein